MSPALYVFRLAWPFLKELLLGGLTLKEGMKTAKKKVFVLFFVSGLIVSLMLIIPRFYQLSQEHLELKKSVDVANVQRMEARIKELEKMPPVVKVPEPTLPTTTDSIAKTDISKMPDSSVAEKPKTPRKPSAKETPIPVTAKVKEEKITDRKKQYMDFFDKYE